jgi:5-formyltetrahydrofolate cyclo-ligase
MRALRSAIPDAERRNGDLVLVTLADSPIPVWENAVVSGYLAIGDEINPTPMMQFLHDRWNCRVCLPVMTGRDQPLTFRAYAPGDVLAAVPWGIREPTSDKPVVEPDVLLVPLLAVDRAGYRLGYGGGYYDRTLKRLRALKPVLAIGLAFDAQVIDAVPHLDYDERIDAVLTPSGYRTFPL